MNNGYQHNRYNIIINNNSYDYVLFKIIFANKINLQNKITILKLTIDIIIVF